ncbi:MAG: T6SS effector amidase Tae4 family protein [Polyangiaceae bacterium]
MTRKLSGFERMWNVYPAPSGEAPEAKKIIGGGADASWIQNTCVIRLSRSLNYGGHPIPQGLKGLSTVTGLDGLRYAYRVAEIDAYLRDTYGPPHFEDIRQVPADSVPATFVGKRGIIGFQVKGWADATGHFDLWDGDKPRHAEFFRAAASVLLWLVESDGTTHLGPGASPIAIEKAVGPGAPNQLTDVARVQAMLVARGFDAGPSDGLLGPRTTAAIVELQKAMGKEPDGRVDPNGATWRDLNGI